MITRAKASMLDDDEEDLIMKMIEYNRENNLETPTDELSKSGTDSKVRKYTFKDLAKKSSMNIQEKPMEKPAKARPRTSQYPKGKALRQSKFLKNIQKGAPCKHKKE